MRASLHSPERRPTATPDEAGRGVAVPPRALHNLSEGRWADRPVLAGMLRAVAFVLPLGASLAAAWVLARALPTPESGGARVLWWMAVAATSIVALLAFDRVARRLLPLAALLNLSLVFPDRAPSRLGVALRSGSTGHLQERAVHDLQDGNQEPATAARTIITLAASLNAHDRGTRGHSERVRAYADLIAEELGLAPEDRDRLRWAALLHDLGKLSVPTSTLNTHEALSDDDWATLRRHPLEGARLAAPLRSWLGPWATAIEQHHERYDGTGYPYGLSGEQLSLAARIVGVADSYDAMTSVRSYSSGITSAAARQELARKAGTDFDPAVVRAFLNVGLGRVRWVMGPLAFFSVVPFAPGLGGLRKAVTNSGRTVALGTASLIATASIVAPQVDPPPTRVLGERVERSTPRARPAPAPAADAIAEIAPLAPEVVDVAVGPPASEAGSSTPLVVIPTAPAVTLRPVASAPAIAAPAPAPPPAAKSPAPEPPVRAAAPAAVPPPVPPASDPPPPSCRPSDRPGDGPDCPPRWGHTEQRPPKSGGKDDPTPRPR